MWMHGGKASGGCEDKQNEELSPANDFPEFYSLNQKRGHKTSLFAAIEHSLVTNKQQFHAEIF